MRTLRSRQFLWGTAVLALVQGCGGSPAQPTADGCPSGGTTLTQTIRVTSSCSLGGDLVIRGGATLDIDYTGSPGAAFVVAGNITVADQGTLSVRGGTFVVANDRNSQWTIAARDHATVRFDRTTFQTTPPGSTGTGSRFMSYAGTGQSTLSVTASTLDVETAWLLASCAGQATISATDTHHVPTEIYPDEGCKVDLTGPQTETGIWLPSPPVGSLTLPDLSGPYSLEVSRATGLDVDWTVRISNALVGLGLLSRPGSRMVINGRGRPATGEFKIGYFLAAGADTLDGLRPGLQNGVVGGGRLTLHNVQLGPIAWQVYALDGARGVIRHSVINEVGLIGNGARVAVDSSLLQLAVLAVIGTGSELSVSNSDVWNQSIEAFGDSRVLLTNTTVHGSLFLTHAAASIIRIVGGALFPNPPGCSPATMVDIATGQPNCNPFRPAGPPQRAGPGTVTCEGTANCSF